MFFLNALSKLRKKKLRQHLRKEFLILFLKYVCHIEFWNSYQISQRKIYCRYINSQ